MSGNFKCVLNAKEVLALPFSAMLAVLNGGVAVVANNLEVRPK
jgi:hypothetical protein